MKKSKIKLVCLCVFAILTSITAMNAKEYENLPYEESLDRIPEEVLLTAEDPLTYPAFMADENLERQVREAYSNSAAKIVALAPLSSYCYEWKKVWVWSGWFPKRVWKQKRVTCPQAAGGKKGPGTTVPPHRA